MLIFDSWPPVAGKVRFSKSSIETFTRFKEANDELSESDTHQSALRQLAYSCGKLVSANADPFMTRRIGRELSDTEPEIIDLNAREVFMESYSIGVQAEIQPETVSEVKL